MDRSNPLFRRMVLTLMHHQIIEYNQTEKILSTPPPSVISSSTNQNSTLDFDFQTLSDFEQTTFEDQHFHIHHLPNL
jgi:hypothetical protein